MADDWEWANFGSLARDGTGDYDADQLPDAEEFARCSNPALKDTDGDGADDYAETIAGTGICDPADCLRVRAVMAGDDELILWWPSVTGRVYAVGAATNIQGQWMAGEGQTNLAGTGGIVSVTNGVRGARGPCFYRVEVGVAP